MCLTAWNDPIGLPNVSQLSLGSSPVPSSDPTLVDDTSSSSEEEQEGEDDGRLFVRAHERGKLVRDEVHESVDGVVESLVTDMAAQLARTYEARHRRPREDSRRQWFHLSELWLSRVELAWGDRLHSDHVAVLRESPFNDDRDVP